MSASTNETISQVNRLVDCLFAPEDIVRLDHVSSNIPRGVRAGELADTIDFSQNDGLNTYSGVHPRQAMGGQLSKRVSCHRCLFAVFIEKTIDQVHDILAGTALPEPTLVIGCGNRIHTFWRLDNSASDPNGWLFGTRGIATKLGSERGTDDPFYDILLPGQIEKETGDKCEIIDSDPLRRYPLKRFYDKSERDNFVEQAADDSDDDLGFDEDLEFDEYANIPDLQCRDPLITWQGVLFDGHNQLGRRNITKFQRIELAKRLMPQIKAWASANKGQRTDLH